MIMEKIEERKNCKKVALRYKEQNITYQQLYNTLAYNQKFLKDQGYKKEDVVYIQSGNQFEFVMCLLSLFSIDCWVVPIHKSVSAVEVEKVQALTGAIKLKEAEIKECTSIKEYDEMNLLIPDSNEYGVYHMTSGSTGTPKLCVRSAYNFYIEGISFKHTFSISEEEEVLSICPLEHSFAFGSALMNGMVNGFTLHIVDEFKPRSILKYIEKNKISMLIMVPAMTRMILATALRDKENYFSSLRIPLVGAGPITENVFTEFKTKFGVSLLSNYGSTETGCVISRTEAENYQSVGQPMYGVDIKVCDENGHMVASGEQGQLFVRWKGMFRGYLNQDTLFDEDGFFSLGDLVVRDEEGNIYIKGRVNTLINIGGKKVNPIEIEKVLLSIPNVKDCKVFSTKAKWGEEIIKAYVVCKNITKIEIFEYLEDRLSEYKIPTVIEFVAEIERNTMGKVNKKSLV